MTTSVIQQKANINRAPLYHRSGNKALDPTTPARIDTTRWCGSDGNCMELHCRLATLYSSPEMSEETKSTYGETEERTSVKQMFLLLSALRNPFCAW